MPCYRLMIACLAIILPAGAAWANPSDFAEKLAIVGGPTISAYEPVVVRQELTNASNHKVWFNGDGDYNRRIEIRDAKGVLVGQTPMKPVPGDFMGGGSDQFAPKQTRTYYLVVSAIYTFKTPGAYKITVMEGDTPYGSSPGPSYTGVPNYPPIQTASRMGLVRFYPWRVSTVALSVLPYDAKKLDARCKEAFRLLSHEPACKNDWSPTVTRWQVLLSIRHDAVLPYLKTIGAGGNGHTWEAVLAMKRIGSKQAVPMAASLAARKGKVGRSARYAMNGRNEVSSYDWLGEDTYGRRPK